MYSTAHMKGKRYMRASHGRHAGYMQIDYNTYACYLCVLPTGDMQATCRSTTCFPCVSIVKPVGYTRNTRVENLTPVWPTEVFVL